MSRVRCWVSESTRPCQGTGDGGSPSSDAGGGDGGGGGTQKAGGIGGLGGQYRFKKGDYCNGYAGTNGALGQGGRGGVGLGPEIRSQG